jgi:hypothetical protein
MKTTKIKEVAVGVPFKSQYGNDNGELIPHTYTMEDGTTLNANHKSEEPFKAGDTVEYEVTGEDKKGNTKGKVSKPSDFKGGGGSKKGGYDTLGQQIGNCISNACMLAAHGKIEMKALESTVHRLMEIGNSTREKFEG